MQTIPILIAALIGADHWSQEIHVPQTIEGAFARGDDTMATHRHSGRRT